MKAGHYWPTFQDCLLDRSRIPFCLRSLFRELYIAYTVSYRLASLSFVLRQVVCQIIRTFSAAYYDPNYSKECRMFCVVSHLGLHFAMHIHVLWYI